MDYINQQIALGIDIGGTKIEVALIEISKSKNLEHKISLDKHNFSSFQFISRKRTPTLREQGYKDVINRLSQLIKESLKESNLSKEDIHTIGIGMPGSVNPLTKKMIHGNSEIFEDKDILTDLQKLLTLSESFKKKMFIENDANCFALAEAIGGAGKLFHEQTNIPFSEQISIGIILGTGVGGGTIIKGSLLSGKMGGGSEVGHTNLYPNGRQCYCDRKGCVELYLSGTGIEKSYNLINPSMSEDPVKSLEIFKMYNDKSDSNAKDVIEEYKNDLSRFLTNLSNLLDPHYFVLGGGVSNQDAIYKNLNEEIKRLTFLKEFSPIVYKNQLGDSAGVIGAALLPYL